MSSTTWRRKYSQCELRIRESCLFRKLRKNKCSVSSSSEVAGRRWGNSQVTCTAIYPQTLNIQPYYHHQQQHGELSAMDAEAASLSAGPSFLSFSAGSITAPEASVSNLMRFHQNSLSASDMSMEMDSGVDPETGERAQG